MYFHFCLANKVDKSPLLVSFLSSFMICICTVSLFMGKAVLNALALLSDQAFSDSLRDKAILLCRE